jgi:hypothetical protein
MSLETDGRSDKEFRTASRSYLRGRKMSMEITWGDTVLVAQDAPAEFHPGLGGSVCGMRDQPAYLEGLEEESTVSGGLYLVEFSDGEAIEIPEKYLRKMND